MDQERPGFAPPPAGDEPFATPAEPGLGGTEVVASHSRGRSRTRTGLIVAAVAVAAVGIAGTAYAATNGSSSPSAGPGMGQGFDRDGDHQGLAPGAVPSGAPSGQALPGDGDRMMGGALGGMRGLAAALHGTFVASDGKGGYQTYDLQRGKVTAVTSSSITVKSDDGFEKSYDVTSTTQVNRGGKVTDVKSGATVIVMGVESGSSVNAQTILDLSAMMGFGHPDMDGDHGGPLTPNATPTTSGTKA